MKRLTILASAILIATSLPIFAANLYISPNGSDNNSGTKNAPLKTIMAAQAAAERGDTVYIRAGTYYPTNADISQYQAPRSIVNNITKDGISYINYPGEHPIFDFSQGPASPENRVTAFGDPG
ncbi:DUF1565 domain-containing protein [Vibrio sp. PP-XX7]